MGQRLRVKMKKRRRDQETAFKKGEAPRGHKIALKRSKKALAKSIARSK